MNDNKETENIFINICKLGKIKSAKYFIEKSDINIHFDSDKPFRICCEYGNLKLAKWLLKNYPNIDIYAKEYYALIKSCRNGFTEVVKWLNKKCLIKHKTIFLEAFYYSCKNSDIEMIDWLYKNYTINYLKQNNCLTKICNKNKNYRFEITNQDINWLLSFPGIRVNPYTVSWLEYLIHN